MGKRYRGQGWGTGECRGWSGGVLSRRSLLVVEQDARYFGLHYLHAFTYGLAWPSP